MDIAAKKVRELGVISIDWRPDRVDSQSRVNALRWNGQAVQVESTPAPSAGAGEAIVRTRAALIAPADVARATPGQPPITLGHQVVGVVEALASDASAEARAKWVGARVAVWPVVSCAACERCRSGLPQHCPSRVTMGLRGRDGGCAEAIAAPVRQLAALPEHLSDDAAVFAAAVASAAHVVQTARADAKSFVTILGDSPEALIMAQLMVRTCPSVRVLGQRAERFTLCERWGIKHRHQEDAGRRADQHVVIDAIGTPTSLALAGRLARPRASIIIPAIDPGGASGAGIAGELGELVAAELHVQGVRGGTLADGVARLARGEVDVLPLIAARKRLTDGVEAMRLAAQPETMRVVLSPG